MTPSQKILTEIFISEAVLEFPDKEIEPMNRVIASAARRGVIPRDAAEAWEVIPDSERKAKAEPKVEPKKSVSKPKVLPKSDPQEPSSRTGRVIPATNRFRQPDASPDASTKATPKKPQVRTSGGPGLAKRALSAIKGKDVETGLPKPKSAVTKVHGKHGPASNLPRLDRMFGSGDGNEFADDEYTDPGYVSPFAHIDGLNSDEDDLSNDPKVATIAKGLAKAAPNVSKPRFPEADVWDSLSGKGEEPDGPPKKKKQQGRLSRFFKGRRDDDI